MQLFNISEPNSSSDEISKDAHDEVILGIDLGTTNSLVGFKKGEEIIFFNGNDTPIIPSIVSYQINGEVKVGFEAALHKNAFRSIKRFMGKPPNTVKTIEYKIIPDNRLLKFDTSCGPKTPTEISAEILKHLKQLAENKLIKTITKAVITVPAYFDEAARAATKDAARIANLEVVRILSEPTAAAIAYGFQNNTEGIYAIYDLGGGTFDVSILKIESGVFQVLATNGDTILGGNDFDEIILELLLDKSHLKVNNIDYQLALIQSKSIREYLSNNNIWEGKFFEVSNLTVTKGEFELSSEALINKTINIFKNALKDAEILVEELNEIILVGGATRMPCIRSSISRTFGKEPLCELDPDKTVAIGAILQAFNLQSTNANLLLDVTPLSLKIELGDNVAETIMPRNTPIPAIKTYNFTTQKDGQNGFIIHILQGEGNETTKCRSLAKFELKGIPSLPAGGAKLEVTFQIDADGLLYVKAKELITMIEQEILVKPSYGLTEEEILRLLKN